MDTDMPTMHKLNAAALKSLPPGKYPDGGNLYFKRREDGGAQWVFRFTAHGRRREMGIGPFPDVSLREARLSAEQARALQRQGLDPIKEKERQRREQERNMHVLAEVAKDAFEVRKAELKGDGKAGRWFSPLELHVLPKIGQVPIGEIDQIDIRNALAPIWKTKAETARKALNRLKIVMQHADSLGLEVNILAPERAKNLLGKQDTATKHIPAMPYADVPDFYASLTDGSPTQLALRLLILTAVRSHPIRFMRLDQIEDDIWTIPAAAMKGRKGKTEDFRVPLSDEALNVIEQAKALSREGYLFPSVRKGVISDATMARMMERRGLVERPHGFRSSFRDWIAENDIASYEVAEMCLGHAVGSGVERSYKRTDFLEQRRAVMQSWANHVCRSVETEKDRRND